MPRYNSRHNLLPSNITLNCRKFSTKVFFETKNEAMKVQYSCFESYEFKHASVTSFGHIPLRL